MNLASPSDKYDRRVFTAWVRVLDQENDKNYKKLQDIEVVPGQRVILSSPDGHRFALAVSNTGVITAVPA